VTNGTTTSKKEANEDQAETEKEGKANKEK